MRRFLLFTLALALAGGGCAYESSGTTTTTVVDPAAVVALGGVALFYRPLLVLCFNEQKAATLGLRPRLTHLLMMGLITLAVVSSFQAVGALLVFGLLVAPPATAVLVARRVPTVMVVAAALGLAEVVAGLLISYHFDTAAGATMSGLAVTVFFLVLGAGQARAALSGRRAQAPAGDTLG